MIATSAHLIDHTIPRVPVRHCVLSFAWQSRMLFASRPQALSRCLAVTTRAIQTEMKVHQSGVIISTASVAGLMAGYAPTRAPP